MTDDPTAPQDLIELAPLVHRVARLDPAALIRIRRGSDRIGALAILPSGALVGRTLIVEAAPRSEGAQPRDWTTRASDLDRWLGGAHRPVPQAMDAAWKRAVPPERGWRRIDAIPASVVRRLVHQGADAHRSAAEREAGARAAQTLLETPVLTLASAQGPATLSNRELAAIVSMAFLPDDGEIVVARNGRWTRAAARFGSVFVEEARGGLLVL